MAVITSAALCSFAAAQQPAQMTTIDQPDAMRTKMQLSSLLNRYPPALKGVLALDPSLLSNQAYIAPYPALAGFLNTHPEIARNPSYYVGELIDRRNDGQEHMTPAMEIWRQVLNGLSIFLAFGMAIGVVTWLIRTVIDYRRWNKLAKVQADVHTRILDRFTNNDELLAYIQSHAGKRFLESSPIMLEEGPRSVGAPLGRILWSVQAGLVLAAAGIGLQMIASQFSDEAAQPLKVLGPLGIALGIGFVSSAGISFLISRRLGLIETPSKPPLPEPPIQQ